MTEVVEVTVPAWLLGIVAGAYVVERARTWRAKRRLKKRIREEIQKARPMPL